MSNIVDDNFQIKTCDYDAAFDSGCGCRASLTQGSHIYILLRGIMTNHGMPKYS